MQRAARLRAPQRSIDRAPAAAASSESASSGAAASGGGAARALIKDLRMKLAIFTLAFVISASPAYAQLGGLGKTLGKANDAANKAQKLKDLKISDGDE